MRCGHAMHVACHAEYCKTNYKWVPGGEGGDHECDWWLIGVGW